MIIFMGLAGSGKSTQAALIAKELGCARLSVGDLLRAHMSGEAAQKMLAGEILADEELLPLLDSEMQKFNGQEFVLDGSPRTMPQAEWLVNKDKSGEIKITAIIHLHISKQAAKIRLLARGRPDDHEMAIAERFREYDEAIMPILQYLKSQGYSVHEIDGEHATTTVAADVERVLGLHQKTHEA